MSESNPPRGIAGRWSGNRRRLAIPTLFAGVWLLALGFPLSAALALTDPVARVATVVLIVGYAAVYLWSFVAARRQAWTVNAPDTPGQKRARYLRYALIVVLAAALTLILGPSGLSTWPFVAVAGLWTFPLLVGIGLAVLIAGASLLPVFHGEGTYGGLSIAESVAFAVLAVGGAMIASRRGSEIRAVRVQNAAALAVEEERTRVARDLHDILGHSLTVIRVKSELASRLVESDPRRAQVEMEEVESLAREALADVRGAVEGFREISLSAEIAHARNALAAAGIEAHLPSQIDVADHQARQLYAWALREGVTNVIRHSGATRCEVVADDSSLHLCDDGTGLVDGPTGRSGGHGLTGLRERARTLGATVDTRPVTPHGLELVVTLPMEAS